MTGAIRLLLGVVLLAGAGALTAALLRLRSLTEFLVATYVFAWAWLVCVTFGLSPLRLVTTAGLLGGGTVALGLSATAWIVSGRPMSVRLPDARAVWRVVRDPALLILLAVTVPALAYSLVLAVAVAPNDWDALTYHLARAAFWRQGHAVGLIAHASDGRLNYNPPNAEIGQLFVLTLDGRDRFVNLVQLPALLALALGVFAIARRVGVAATPALFGSLVLLLLPLPLLQASSSLNDLVVASFLVAAVCFLLSTRPSELAAGGSALALALGTKFTGALAFPVVVAVALLGPARSRLRRLGAVFALAVAAGAYWYVVNVVETGSLDGGLAVSNGQYGTFTLGTLASKARQYLTDALEFPAGNDGGMRICLAVGAAVLVIGLIVRRLGGGWSVALAGAIVAAVPAGGLGLVRLSEWSGADASLYAHSADTAVTWYGPVAALLLPLSLLASARAARAGAPAVQVLLAAAPLAFAVVIVVALSYDPLRGRFFVFPVALSAAVWGTALRRRAVAAAVAVLTVTVLVISLTDYLSKPSGLHLVKSLAGDSLWGMPRLSQQLVLRGTSDPSSQAVAYISTHAPARAAVALALQSDDYVAPYFGPRYQRHVTFLDPARPAPPPAATWVVSASRIALPACRWSVTARLSAGWRIYRRVSSTCRSTK